MYVSLGGVGGIEGVFTCHWVFQETRRAVYRDDVCESPTLVAILIP